MQIKTVFEVIREHFFSHVNVFLLLLKGLIGSLNPPPPNTLKATIDNSRCLSAEKKVPITAAVVEETQ